MREVYEFLKQSGVFYIATDDNGQPRVRPFGAICVFENKLYIMTSNQKPVYKQLEKNPNTEISSMTPDGRWIRLSAQVVRDERFEARRAMLDANPDLRRMYSEDDGKIEVLFLKNAKAVICSFTAAPETYTF
ncbi:MAG: pyridoxamine 5'-phosphate oxidase family protein [Clostridia bacterium]|nr:pyridoxamine 5'-phosphate oxidase family protein [Clostridia bacterium]